MRSKLWWFTSAAILWTVCCFAGLIGLVGKSFEYLFEGRDASAVILAGGYWLCFAAGSASLVAWVLAGTDAERTRAQHVFADIGAQAAFIGLGGLLACAYAVHPSLAFGSAPLAVIVAPILACPSRDRTWRRWGLAGLAATSFALIVFLGR